MINQSEVKASMNKTILAIFVSSIVLSTIAVADDGSTSIERISVIGSKEDLKKIDRAQLA